MLDTMFHQILSMYVKYNIENRKISFKKMCLYSLWNRKKAVFTCTYYFNHQFLYFRNIYWFISCLLGANHFASYKLFSLLFKYIWITMAYTIWNGKNKYLHFWVKLLPICAERFFQGMNNRTRNLFPGYYHLLHWNSFNS